VRATHSVTWQPILYFGVVKKGRLRLREGSSQFGQGGVWTSTSKFDAYLVGFSVQPLPISVRWQPVLNCL